MVRTAIITQVLSNLLNSRVLGVDSYTKLYVDVPFNKNTINVALLRVCFRYLILQDKALSIIVDHTNLALMKTQ